MAGGDGSKMSVAEGIQRATEGPVAFPKPTEASLALPTQTTTEKPRKRKKGGKKPTRKKKTMSRKGKANQRGKFVPLLQLAMRDGTPVRLAFAAVVVVAIVRRSLRKRGEKERRAEPQARQGDGKAAEAPTTTTAADTVPVSGAEERSVKEEHRVGRAAATAQRAAAEEPSTSARLRAPMREPQTSVPATATAASQSAPAPGRPALAKGSTWGRVILFLLVLVSVLEACRQLDPADFGLVITKEAEYQSYLLVCQKVFCLLLAWFSTLWITLLSRRYLTWSGSGSSREHGATGEGRELRFPATGAGVESGASTPTFAANGAGAVPEVNFTGIWIRDRKRSDSFAGVCQLACINPLLSKAICLVKGSELRHTRDTLSIRVFSEIPWFALREHYEFASETLNRRRDFRRGKMRCTMERTKEGGLRFVMEWPEPLDGQEVTYYNLIAENTLQVSSVLTVRQRDGENKSLAYQSVYHRRPR